MLDFLYTTGWGAFTMLLFFQLPFLIGFMLIVMKRSKGVGESTEAGISKAKVAWMTAVVVLFFAVNLASIKYIPAVSTANALANEKDIVDVKIEASSWSYDMTEQEFKVGQAVRFSAKALDTVHGFAIYDPKGNVIFTMMLVPGVGESSLIHKFKEPGTYKVRCLEYCGIVHHDMSDEIIVTANAS